MIQIFEQLRNAEKTLDAVKRRLRETDEELLVERRRNIELAQQLCKTIDSLCREKSDRKVYQAGFWILCALCCAYILISL